MSTMLMRLVFHENEDFHSSHDTTKFGACDTSHTHGSACGHPAVQHGDHTDYVVGDEIHCNANGQCSVHGHVYFESDEKGSSQEKNLNHPATSRSRQFLRRRLKKRQPFTKDSGSSLLKNDALEGKPPDESVKAKGSKGDKWRFTLGFLLTALFMVVEFVVGILIGSLALQADAFHMASDVLSMVIGWYAAHKSRQPRTKHATYGFRRLEIVGALINCVFLLSICFNISIEALQRLFQYEEIASNISKEVDMLLIVGGLGLLVNILALVVFSVGHGHGHSHGGHGHSHGGHGHSHSASNPSRDHIQQVDTHSLNRTANSPAVGGTQLSENSPEVQEMSEEIVAGPMAAAAASAVLTDGQDIEISVSESEGETEPATTKPKATSCVTGSTSTEKHQKKKRKIGLNVQGVLLHVAGDALGSIAVIVSGLLIKYLSSPLRGLADPLTSFFIVILLITGTLRPLRRAIAILTQSAPHVIDTHGLEMELKSLSGVVAVHDLHVWQLDEQRMIGSVHLTVPQTIEGFDGIQDSAKNIFHAAGVHATTVQIEALSMEELQRLDADRSCLDPVCGDDCVQAQCCPDDLK